MVGTLTSLGAEAALVVEALAEAAGEQLVADRTKHAAGQIDAVPGAEHQGDIAGEAEHLAEDADGMGRHRVLVLGCGDRLGRVDRPLPPMAR